MARIRVLTDEHVPKAVARGLRERGIDARTMTEAGTLGAEDAWILAHAREEGLVVMTQDVDYLRMHARGVSHAGIIYAASGTSIGDMIRGALLLAELVDAEAMKDHVEFL